MIAGGNQKPCTVVYKILPRHAWDQACLSGAYLGSADDQRDGFIHLSAGPQLTGTATKYFSNQKGLVLIALHPDDLGTNLKWEKSRGGALFPHLYGPLNTSHAVWARDLPLGNDGAPVLPKDLTL